MAERYSKGNGDNLAPAPSSDQQLKIESAGCGRVRRMSNQISNGELNNQDGSLENPNRDYLLNHEPTQGSLPKIIMTPTYVSKGPGDILNRTNILKICRHVPVLSKVCSVDLESLSFIASTKAPSGEATLITLKNVPLFNVLLWEKQCFLNWGSEIERYELSKYTYMLNQQGGRSERV